MIIFRIRNKLSYSNMIKNSSYENFYRMKNENPSI